MPEYVLRNIDPTLWSQFTERANREGWRTKALLVRLIEAYASGSFTPPAPPPKELPQWAWLRGYYRQAAANHPDFVDRSFDDQWELLFEYVLRSPAGLSWRILNEVPLEQRADILRWLRETSALPVRHLLTLRAIAHIGSGPDLKSNRRAFQYEVLGLPPGQQAWIADFRGGWRILRVVNGDLGEWGAPHLEKEDAVDALAQAIDESPKPGA